MVLLQGLQGLFIALDSRLELANVFGAPLSEGSLSLSVPLLTFLRGSIYLEEP